MSEFDIESPPTSYRKFRKSVLQLLENTPMELDEEYPIALFLVSKDNEGDIVYPSEIAEELELPEEFPVSFVIHNMFPMKVAKFNSKFFGLVFQGTHEDEEGDENDILICLFGSSPTQDEIFGNMHFLKSNIVIEDDELELDPWEPIDLDTYPELIVPFRKSIVHQG